MNFELFSDFATNIIYPSNITTIIETKWSLMLFFVGTILLFLLKYSKIRKFILISTKKRNGDLKKIQTIYDNLEEEKLEKIINKLTNNYRIVIAVYGVLLSFVVSDILITKEPNWSIILWTGWIIGFTVRIGVISITLSDKLETKKHDESLLDIAQYVFASKNFLKHILIVLIPLIALLPVTAVPTETSYDNTLTQFNIFSLAGGIIGVAFFIYLITNIEEFQTVEGPKFLYMLILGFIFIGAFLHGTSNPLQPVTILFFGNSEIVPLIFDGFRYISGIFGAVLITIFGKGIIHNFIIFFQKSLPKIKLFFKDVFSKISLELIKKKCGFLN
jgi:hypothetical protein